MNKSFERWAWQRSQVAPLPFKDRETLFKRANGDYCISWVSTAWEAWQAAKTDPDPATVALHFGYEVTKIRDQVFIAKNNIGMKLWVPFSRESHPKQFQEYDRCS